ncbi:MAG: hypothetical protein ABDI19_00360 [Armatimonadota bacterium]
MDNPIAWLLRRYLGYSNLQSFSSKVQELEKALQRARDAQDKDLIEHLLQVRGTYLRGLMAPQPFWKRSDRWWALFLWCLSILIVISCFVQGWQAQLQQVLRFPIFLYMASTMFLFTPFGYGAILHRLLVHERQHGTDAFLWLTRLTGRHIVYGAIATLGFQYQLRSYLVFVTPFAWLVGTLIWGSWLRGLWVVAMVGWLFGNFALLWLVVSALFLPDPHKSLVNQLLYLLMALLAIGWIAMGAFLLSSVAMVNPSAPTSLFARADTTPVWGWLGLPSWWLSLLPPLGIISLLFVAHPLWGIPQGLVYLGLTALLLPFAVRAAERVRLRPEPEVQPDEGDW